MTRAARLGWLVQLARDPQQGQLTPQQLVEQVVLGGGGGGARRAGGARFVDASGGAAAAQSLYWVWLEGAGWRRSVRELVGLIENHVKVRRGLSKGKSDKGRPERPFAARSGQTATGHQFGPAGRLGPATESHRDSHAASHGRPSLLP